MKFHEKLQMLRKEKGMSQEDLADRLTVSRQAISKWESAQAYPETEKLIALSNLFSVTVDELLKDGKDISHSDSVDSSQNEFWRVHNHWYTAYEYKSKKTIFGLPLVHINVGRGLKKAKGIIAIGNMASGIVAIGLASIGVVSIGLVSIGFITIAIFAAALFLAFGTIAVGTIAFGAVAIGIFSIGALSIGMFSLGACSLASHIAIGSYAEAHIAIGEMVSGIKTIEVTSTRNLFKSISSQEVRALIDQEFPHLWKWISSLIANLFR